MGTPSAANPGSALLHVFHVTQTITPTLGFVKRFDLVSNVRIVFPEINEVLLDRQITQTEN